LIKEIYLKRHNLDGRMIFLKKFFVFLFIGILLLVGVFEFAAPRIMSRGIEMALSKMADGKYEVDLRSHPSLKMLLGRFDSIEVTVYGIEVAGVRIDELATKINDVKLDIQKLVFNRTLDFQGKKDIQGSIRISEKNLSEALVKKGFKDFTVIINPGKATVKGGMKLINKPFDIVVEGRFVPRDKTKVAFLVDRVKIGEVSLPEKLQENLLSGTIFYIDLGEAPIPVKIDDVLMQQGELLLKVSD